MPMNPTPTIPTLIILLAHVDHWLIRADDEQLSDLK